MSKQPLYKGIEADLLMKIENDEYAEGSIIPKEVELAKAYGVSRPTVRQAIQNLVAQGYLTRKKRLGTIVTKRKIDQEFATVIESFDSEMKRKGLLPTTTVISFKQDVATEEVAQHLHLEEGDAVCKLIRLRYAESKPIVLVTTYIPMELIPDLLSYDFSSASLYSIFGEHHIHVARIRRKLDVINADETVSDLLEVDEGAPLFYFHSTAFDTDDQPVEYSISKYRGDTNSFVFEIRNQ
ncbi:transcriptional regulator [Erysipelotrichaceae bacterium MTC7]|nr:transcriptional regulator [Erysipelotrichaceae bacterium MTC7]